MNILNATNTVRFHYQFEDFVDYVFFFYRDVPHYCSNKTPYAIWEIERAVKRFYRSIKEFDSIDRENVKYVMEAYRQLKGDKNGTKHQASQQN